jgi:hypothetical protein
MIINSQLIACKTYRDKFHLYVKHKLRVDTYFQVLTSKLF